jgi:predicted DNA-binding ribbon-helix-helix protein
MGAARPNAIWTQTRRQGSRTWSATGSKRETSDEISVVKRHRHCWSQDQRQSEDGFWKSLKEIAGERHVTLSELVASIDTDRQYGNLSSAIRLFVLDFYRNRPANDKDGRDGARDAIAMPPAPTA